MNKPQVRTAQQAPIAAPLSILMVMLILAALLAGCNTTAGLGRDMQSAGTGIEHKAEKNGAQ